MKRRNAAFLKKLTSLVLACGMVVGQLSTPLTINATESQKQKQAATMEEEQLKTALSKGSEEHPNGLFAFGKSQITATEGEDTSLMIVRSGGTKGEAKVTLSIVDVSAKYGEDYLASVTEQGKTTILDQNGGSQTLLERYGSDLVAGESAVDETEAEESVKETAEKENGGETAKLSEEKTVEETTEEQETTEQAALTETTVEKAAEAEHADDAEDAAAKKADDAQNAAVDDAGEAVLNDTVEAAEENIVSDAAADDSEKAVVEDAAEVFEGTPADASDDIEATEEENAAAIEAEESAADDVTAIEAEENTALGSANDAAAEEENSSEENEAAKNDTKIDDEIVSETDNEIADDTDEEDTEVAATAKSTKDDKKTAETTTEDAVTIDSLHGLAKAQAAQNGSIYDEKTWREVEADSQNPDDEAAKELGDQSVENLKELAKEIGGITYTFTFKEGEYKKTVDLSLIDDTISETDEQVMFFLQDAEGADLSDNYTAYLNIQDNEEKEEISYQIPANDIKVPRGTDSIEITVERTSGIQQMGVLSIGTSEKTAKAGIDYESFSEDLVFAPGVTSKTVTVNLLSYPLDEQPTEDVFFYVGAKAKNGTVDESKNAAKITILANQDAMTTYGEEMIESSAEEKGSNAAAKDMQTKAQSTAVFSGDYGRWASGFGYINAFGSYDLRTASEIRVTFDSTEGSRTVREGSGCKAHDVTYRDRRVQFYLCTPTKAVSFYNQTSSSFGSTTAIYSLPKDMKGQVTAVHCYFGPVNNNNSAAIHVRNITVVYPGYIIKMNNDSTNAKGAAINPYNVHVETSYTGSATSTKVKNLRLGYGYINGDSSHTFYKYEASKFTYAFNAGDKTSNGVTISGNNTTFKGFQIKQTNGTWKDIGSGTSLPDIVSLINNYSNCMQSGNVFEIRPKFEVKKANLKFLNNGSAKVNTTKNGKTTQTTVNKANMGSFSGFNNNSSFTTMTLLDSLTLTASAKAGYAVYGFSTTSGNSEIAQVQTGEVNRIKLLPSTTNQINIDINYEKSGIDVVADPSGKNTKQGSVIYYDASGKNTASGNSSNKMTVEGVSIGGTYSIVAVPNSTGNTKTAYRATWRDGTIDLDGNGLLSEKEKNANKNYSGFTPVKGNVLTMIPQRAYTKAYYDFELRQAITAASKRSYVVGRVNLQDSELFTGKTTETQLNGVNVSVGEESGITKYYRGDRNTDEGDGYFEFSGDGTYYAHDYLLLAVSYTADDGSSITANKVVNPDIFENIILKTDSVMNVDSAQAFTVEKDWRGKETETAIKYNELDNGDTDYRLKFHVTSKNSNLQPRTGTLRFFNTLGNEIADTKITQTIQAKDDGYFTFTFNPEKLKLPKGTTLKFQVQDQNGQKYYERTTGIKLFEKIGMVELCNAFQFGGLGKAIDLMGSIGATIDLGWEGDFDVKTNADLTKDPEDNSLTLLIGISVGGDKKFDNDKLKKATDAKIESEKAYFKALNGGKTSKEDLAKLKKAKQDANKEYYDNVTNLGKSKKKSAKVAGGVSATFTISLAMKFSLDEKESSYYFDSMILCAAVEAGANVEVTFATPIGITIFLGFSIEVDGNASFVIAQREDIAEPTKYYLTEVKGQKTVRDKDGKWNIFNKIGESDEDSYQAYGIFGFNPTITISAGAGALGDLVKVTVSGSAAFKMQFYVNHSGNNGMVNLSASIEVKILFITAKWPFASKNIDLFGSDSKSLGLDEQNYLHEDAKLLQAEEKDYLKNRSGWNGTAGHAKSLDENEQGLTETELLQGVYSGTDIKLTAINDAGDYLGVFLDDELDASGKQVRSDLNSAAVYYTIYDHSTKAWSKPALLEDDKTADQDVAVFDLGSRGILVTWSTANKELTDSMSRTEMLNAMDIHGAFFSKAAKSFGAIQKITKETTEDTVSDVNPSVVYNNDSMIVYYTKNEYEVSNTAEGEVVGDVVYPAYSAMVYRQYKFSGTGTDGAWVEDYADLNDSGATKAEILAGLPEGMTYDDYVTEWYGQVFFDTVPDVYLGEKLDENGFWEGNKQPEIYAGHNVTSNISKNQETGVTEEETKVSGSTVASQSVPKIVDTDAVSYNDLGLFAYTADYDEDLLTVNDRDVFLQIYDFETGVMTHPVMITSDDVSDSNVHFVRVADQGLGYEETYLTWLSDGSIVSLNITNLIRGDLLMKKQTSQGQEYYMINKSSTSGYEPVMKLVEAKVNEESDNAVSAITSFDTASADGYVYVAWTEDNQTLKSGVEENSPDAIDVENQLIEHQVFMARYDLKEGCMTGDVQVTSSEGANYDNISFVVNSDASVTAMATKAGTKIVKADEFNKLVDEHNQVVSEDEKADKVSADDFTEYAAADIENKSLVAMQINPTSVLKVKDFNLEDIAEGEETEVGLTLINDGIDTLEGATLTVTDDSGRSLLYSTNYTEADDTVEPEYTPVDSIKIEKLMGGMTYDARTVVKLDERQTKEAVTISVMSKRGDTLLNETYKQVLTEELSVNNLTVTETDDRDVYDVSMDISNESNRYAKARKAVVGVEKLRTVSEGSMTYQESYDQKELAEFNIPELEKGESMTVTGQVIVDSSKQFTETELANGFLKETGNFYASYGDASDHCEVVREASGAQMDQINGITAGQIGDGKGISVAAGETTVADAVIKSSLADAEVEKDGTEGLQTVWKVEDEDVASVDAYGTVTGIEEGSTKLTAYVIPKNTQSVVTASEENDSDDMNFAEEQSNFVKIPNKAIKTYTTTLTVTKSNEGSTTVIEDTTTPTDPTDDPTDPTDDPGKKTDDPTTPDTPKTSVTKAKITYTINGTTAKVTAADSSIKKAKIKDTVQINGMTYKVTSVGSGVFYKHKSLTKVTVGKNVTVIGADVFNGCTALKTVKLGSSLTKIGTRAFYGCTSLKKLTIPDKVKAIPAKAFMNCTALTTVVIGKKVSSVGANAFRSDSKLKSITFTRKTAPTVGKNAFKGIVKTATFKVPKASLKKYQKVLVKKAGVTKKMKITK